MNIFKAMAVSSVDEAAGAIPVIDFGPAFNGQSGGLDAVAAQVRHACEHVGFFYMAGHSVPQSVIDDAFDAAREFHAMPLEDKLRVSINENNIGYLPFNQSMQRASTVHKATRPNYNESFFISHERGADHPDVIAGLPLRGRNQWPAGRTGMRESILRYFKALESVSEAMLPVLALSLDMPPEYSPPFFADEAHPTLLFLHYPPQESVDDEQFGQAPHTDNSFITILA